MLYQLTSYLKFLKNSTNQHGVHSPFVFELLTSCFYDKTSYPQYSIFKNYRKKIKSSNESIEVTDFGQGSRVFKSNQRKVSAIAKNAGVSSKRQRLLFRLTRYFNFENSLELGTSLGLATSAISLGYPSGKVNTVEGCPNTAKKAASLLKEFDLENITVHTKAFDLFLAENTSETYDLVYVDGNHNKENTLAYFKILVKQTSKDSVLIFDDIYWSKEMTEAWEEIKQHPKVIVSIDTFYWGLVFFRSEQHKEHFNIRL